MTKPTRPLLLVLPLILAALLLTAFTRALAATFLPRLAVLPGLPVVTPK